MAGLTLDLDDLLKHWMKWYLNMMTIKSRNPVVSSLLDEYKDKLAAFNEETMQLFDKIGAKTG